MAPKTPGRARPRKALLWLASVLVVLPIMFVTQASAAFIVQQDESGPNDVPGQKDLNLQAVDTSGLPTSLQVYWNWDETGISGNNTLDACTLFDTDNDAKANFAVCVTAGGTPAQFLARTVYTCGDTRVDRCTSPIATVPNPLSTCSVTSPSATDPFSGSGKNQGASYPNDARGACTIYLADVGATSAKLINTCSYPSQQPNSDPSDCVLIPRDAFLTITKVANGTGGSFPFKLDGNLVFTASGSQSSSVIPITTANNATHSIKEDPVPSDWDLTSVSCSGASDSNGTANSNPIVIDARSDDNVTCTFTDTQKAAPQLKIVKSCTNSAPHAATDRFQPQNNGSSTGLSELACGGDETITLSPDTGYNITEVAGATTPTTSLSNYNVSYSSDCVDANGIPRGTALTTCTITNELKQFTVITLVCAGDSLHSSSVTLDSVTHPSLGSSTSPSEADLCALTGARFDKASGTYSGSVTITP
jgi:hypothetical protein